MNLNKDKETIKKWEKYVGKKVKVYGTRYEDVKINTLGIYIGKHTDIPLHYILLKDEKEARIFHIFEFEIVN